MRYYNTMFVLFTEKFFWKKVIIFKTDRITPVKRDYEFYFYNFENLKDEKMNKQNVISNNYVKFTREELLSIFRVEAQHICKSSDDVHSISESTLNDFIKWHSKYVRFA